mmetsp:Transcript_9000/g.27058  ORF Transcript_9000/g.27058 Transcript_9000/m.27058 type:complete len:211 (-) Transcript_9000:640-1272(-)
MNQLPAGQILVHRLLVHLVVPVFFCLRKEGGGKAGKGKERKGSTANGEAMSTRKKKRKKEAVDRLPWAKPGTSYEAHFPASRYAQRCRCRGALTAARRWTRQTYLRKSLSTVRRRITPTRAVRKMPTISELMIENHWISRTSGFGLSSGSQRVAHSMPLLSKSTSYTYVIFLPSAIVAFFRSLSLGFPMGHEPSLILSPSISKSTEYAST